MHREPEDQSFFGLPGLKIFGAHFQSKHLIALLAATLFLGWKGLALGVAVWIFYKLSQKPQGEAHTSYEPIEVWPTFWRSMIRHACQLNFLHRGQS